MRWIATLIVMLVSCFLFGCSSIGSHESNARPLHITLVGRKAGDPLLRYLNSQGVLVSVDAVGRARLTNNKTTHDALNRWLSIQRATMETVAQNIANKNSICDANGDNAPYRRKVVQVDDKSIFRVVRDNSPWRKKWEPGSELADEDGFVKYPNVDATIEMAIALEASHQFQMTERTIQRLDQSTVTLSTFDQGRDNEVLDDLLAVSKGTDRPNLIRQFSKETIASAIDSVNNENWGIYNSNGMPEAVFKAHDSDRLDLLSARFTFDIRREADEARIDLMKLAHRGDVTLGERSSYKRLERAIIVAKQMIDVSLDNLSNVHTPGFKCRIPIVDGETGRIRIQFDPSQGNAIRTDRPLDVMISGKGYFRVATPNTGNGFAFTRAGSFFVNREGNIVLGNADGPLLEPAIEFPDSSHCIGFSSDGEISGRLPGESQRVCLGSIQLARFKDSSKLKQSGGNLYFETEASGPPVLGDADTDGFGKVLNQFLESSNVDPMKELERIHEYQSHLRVVQAAIAAIRSDERESRLSGRTSNQKSQLHPRIGAALDERQIHARESEETPKRTGVE